MNRVRYPTFEELVEVNKAVITETPVRKADAARLSSKATLQRVISRVRETEGDLHDKAASLLIDLTRLHPFASGNRRTAYVATRLFLEWNGAPIQLVQDPSVLQGVREGFYTREEVKSWLKGDEIRKFSRG